MDKAVSAPELLGLLRGRERGSRTGVWSCCSANEYVIRAALRRGLARSAPVLVEATANQVDQNGGYTGMRPEDFRDFLFALSDREGFPRERLILGGDHLGPLTFRKLPAAEAMDSAETLVRCYASAGFAKLHLDTSMKLADDDPDARLPDEVIAARAARLCAAAEEEAAKAGIRPVYVIGSEVPIPGGAVENEDSVAVTRPGDCEATLRAFKTAFEDRCLSAAWERVIAIVVQPGVEFADESVVEYDRGAARELMRCLDKWPALVFEGHSTDYQPAEKLAELVEDGVAILKVGPALTFALREALFSLERIELELSKLRPFPLSRFRETLDWVMCEDDKYWGGYYHGREAGVRYARAYSLSDRARYCLPSPRVEVALRTLLGNLDREGIPLALLSQYLPLQYQRLRSGAIGGDAESLLLDRIGDSIDPYLDAVCG